MRILILSIMSVASLCVSGSAYALSAEEYFNLGNKYTNEGNIENAILAFKNADKLVPNHPDINYSLGVLLGCTDGIKYYKNTIKHDPKYWQAFYNIGICLEERGLHEEASIEYDKSLLINPNQAKLLYNLGSTFLEKGNNLKAIKYLKSSLNIQPINYYANLNLAIAYENDKKYKLALSSYNQAIDLLPKNPAAYISRSNTLTNMGLTKDAQTSLEAGAKFAIESNNKAMSQAALTNLNIDFPNSRYISALKIELSK